MPAEISPKVRPTRRSSSKCRAASDSRMRSPSGVRCTCTTRWSPGITLRRHITLTRHAARRRCPVHELDRPLVLEEEVVGHLADRRWPVAGVAPDGKKKLVPGIAAGSAMVPEAPLVQTTGDSVGRRVTPTRR